MLTLTLPDGATRQVEEGTLPRDVVASIGPRLLRDALAIEVDGEILDLATPLRKGGAFKVLTAKDQESLDVLRHSGAHILATAVRRLRPDAKIGFGPAIEDGFYYDFEVEEPFTPEDLESFEAEMRKVIADKYPFVREEVSQADARKKFSDDPLKLERLSEFSEDEIISTYTDGPFIDLCRGPHVPDTSYLKHFKLLHTAGAYWRGDEKRQMLQRILRDRVVLEGGSRRVPQSARGSKAPRSPPARPAARSLFDRPARWTGPHSLASARRDCPKRDRNVRARLDSASRIRSRLHTAHREREAVSDLRTPRELQGEHVRRDGGRGRGVSAEADELSGAHLHLSVAATVVSRSADQIRRVWDSISLRAERGAPWNAARSRLYAGRRTRLLHSGAGCLGDRAAARPG